MFQIILLAVFGSCAIAGVLIFALAVGRGDSGGIGAVVIWGSLDSDSFVEVLRTAQDTDQSLLGVTYVYKDADTFMTELTNALASGKGPDMVIMRQDYVLSQESRLKKVPFTSMSDQEFRSTYADAASPFITPGGILGIPFLIDPMILYWNRDILNTNGFAQAPQYWDEVQLMAQKISTRTESGTVTRAAVPFGQYKNVNNAKSILSMLVMQAGGAIVERDIDGTLQAALAPADGAVAQSSLQALRFYTEFADPAKPGYSWNASLPEARKAFIAQDLALYYGLGSERAFISAASPNMNFSVGSSTQRRAAKVSINAGVVYAFAFPRTSQNPAGALAVAFKLNNLENGRLFSNQFKMPSASRLVLDSKFGNELDFLNKQAIIVRSWVDPDPEKTSEIFRAMIEDTVSGKLLLGEAVQRADQELSLLLDMYREQSFQEIQ